MIGAPTIGTLVDVTNEERHGRLDTAIEGDPLELDRQVCFALAVASRSVIALYRPVLEPLGLTHPQYLVMLALWGEQPLSVKDLSHRLALDPGTLSPLVKRLESAGYVHRARAAGDERTLAISLTPAGAALRERALDVPPAIVARLGMPISELEDMHRMLTKLIAAALDREPTPDDADPGHADPGDADQGAAMRGIGPVAGPAPIEVASGASSTAS